MFKKGKLKVAIFFSDFPLNLSLHVTDLVNALAKKGLDIDLFILKCGEDLPKFHKNVNIIALPQETSSPLSLADKIKVFLRMPLKIGKRHFISERVEDILQIYFKQNSYSYCLAIEKRALILLEAVLKIRKVPFAYQSLELYNREAPGIWSEVEMKFLIELEKLMLRKCNLFIIQDKIREKLFFKDRAIKNPPRVFYLPVSISRRNVEKSKYWHRKYALAGTVKVILSIGQIDSDRMVCEAVKAAQKFPDHYKLILHGPVSESTLDELAKLDLKRRVIISHKLVKNDDLFKLSVASNVGLVLYKPTNSDQTTAGKSSHKMAIHALTSTPVICLNQRSFRDVIDEYHCGVCIKNTGGLKEALDTVLSNYNFFKKGTMNAYDNVYCLDKYISGLTEVISNTVTEF